MSNLSEKSVPERIMYLILNVRLASGRLRSRLRPNGQSILPQSIRVQDALQSLSTRILTPSEWLSGVLNQGDADGMPHVIICTRDWCLFRRHLSQTSLRPCKR